MNIPNLLTLLRILLVPLLVIFLIDGEFLKALIIFFVSGISDALDGFLARLLHQKTVLGAYLDPIADKALLISCFLTLSIEGVIPGWLTVVVISRDVIILAGTFLLFMMSVPFEIKPILISKITTALQILTVLLVLVLKSLPESFDDSWILFLYWMTALFTIASGLKYISVGIMHHNRMSEQGGDPSKSA
jgi:cardiolipin synthase (CMP-forming)